jgi:hypothetical protein
MRGKAYEKGTSLPISRPAVLSAALQAGIEKRFGGKIGRAARDAGLAASTLRRLLRGRSNWLRQGVFNRLHSVVEPQPALWARVLWTDFGLRVLWTYLKWIHDTRSRISGTPTFVLPSDFDVEESERRTALREALWTRVCERLPHVRHDFERMVRHHGSDRLELAFDRIVEPLLDATRSASVERSWDELSPREFGRFIELGWKREKMLLRRSGYFTRIRRMDVAISG